VKPFSLFGRGGHRWRWLLVGAYAAVLLASSVARGRAAAPSAPPGTFVLALPAVGGSTRPVPVVRLAYRDVAGTAPGATPILLLHGSPGSAGVFDQLALYLAARRVLAVDLPGFGASSVSVPDYSFRAHALYVAALLDRLGIDRVHVLGFSMGGGVALSLADLVPTRVASLTLLSAIGVQEMELLGEYHLNHAVHGAQLAGVSALRTLVPHGGALDAPYPYARNFYDSDQRPLRAIFTRLQAPTLIVHGRFDPLVPVEAAYEHARLVPQSELRLLDENHFMLFEDTPAVAPPIVEFLNRVDRGLGTPRGRATAARIEAAGAPFDPRIVPRAQAVNAGVLGGMMAIGTWIAAAIVPVGAGVLAAQGRAGYGLAALSSLLGVLIERSRRRSWAGAATTGAITLGRVAAGALVGAALLRAPWPAGAGAWTRAAIVTAVAALACELLVVATSYRRRRLLLSSWRRFTRWEFWPPWAVYPPVALWIAWLAVRYRSATAFTAVNPAMPSGGVVGESKIAILHGLGDSAWIARSGMIDSRLPIAARIRTAEAFMARYALSLPVVLKPDQGQRGAGVVVARSWGEVEEYLRHALDDTVIQEYVPGVEFGVFYARRPSQPRGTIVSITEKRLPFVVADGRRTLEELILDDPRAVCMARFHLAQQAAQLSLIPPAGAHVRLGDCGSHCRGAEFLDGRTYRTAALEEAIDAVSRRYDGFFFGRYDVRAVSADAFARGEFTVIELNGVTSEPTHIYDPRVGLLDAYRALFEQWSLAFEIGVELAKAGAPVTPVWSLGYATAISLLRVRRTSI
jgi:pimeloyl-ACP methyl ester carboxylesterase